METRRVQDAVWASVNKHVQTILVAAFKKEERQMHLITSLQ